MFPRASVGEKSYERNRRCRPQSPSGSVNNAEKREVAVCVQYTVRTCGGNQARYTQIELRAILPAVLTTRRFLLLLLSGGTAHPQGEINLSLYGYVLFVVFSHKRSWGKSIVSFKISRHNHSVHQADGQGPQPLLLPLSTLSRRLDLHGHSVSRRIHTPIRACQVS